MATKTKPRKKQPLTRAQRELRCLEKLDWLRVNKPAKYDRMMALLAQLVAEARSKAVTP